MGDIPSDLDLAWVDPELDAAVAALACRDTAPALALLAATREGFDRREIVVSVLGHVAANHLDLMTELNAARREDPDVLLLWGSALAGAAWNARGADYAEHTTEDQFARMSALVDQARSTLRKAAALAPADPVPWSELLSCALALPVDDNEIESVWKEVADRAPTLFGATTVRLQSLADKWYGSHEEMFAFARERTADLPVGHPLHALIPLAYIEEYLDAISRGNRLKRIWRAMNYFGKSGWRDEVDAAANRMGPGANHPQILAAHQIFAALYHQAEVTDRVGFHIRLAGTRPMQWPWAYFGDPAEEFSNARAAAVV